MSHAPRLTMNAIPFDDPLRPYIIAEASGNHGQNFNKAMALIDAAAASGADAIKFQTFTAEEICADVPILTGHNQRHDAWIAQLGVTRMPELFSKGGLPRAWHLDLKRYAHAQGIAFLSTPFSVEAARFLVEDVGVEALKIASGDLTFTPLLEYAAQTNLPIILSTGGATREEVVGAMRGPLYQCSGMLVIMHCVSVYPADDHFVNLRALHDIRRIGEGFALGFSDHTLSEDLVPALAMACGATVLEKHIKLQEDTTSVDVGHSLDPAAFARYVEAAKKACRILGEPYKGPHPLEMHDRLWARRSPTDWLRPTDEARGGRWQ